VKKGLKLWNKIVILAIFRVSIVGSSRDSLGRIPAAFAAVAVEDGWLVWLVLWSLHGRTRVLQENIDRIKRI
jgi:hypothetical protein